MGIGHGSGESRAADAARQAIMSRFSSRASTARGACCSRSRAAPTSRSSRSTRPRRSSTRPPIRGEHHLRSGHRRAYGGEVKISVIATAFRGGSRGPTSRGPMYKRQAPSVEQRATPASAVAPAPLAPHPRAENQRNTTPTIWKFELLAPALTQGRLVRSEGNWHAPCTPATRKRQRGCFFCTYAAMSEGGNSV